jgi:hypothetical protein
MFATAMITMWSGCFAGGPVVQAVLPETFVGPVVPLEGQGLVVIVNQSTRSVTCLFMRPATTDPAEDWGNRLVTEENPIGRGEQREFPRAEGLYDIGIVQPSTETDDRDVTHVEPQFLVRANQIFTITVNDDSFADVSPNCAGI